MEMDVDLPNAIMKSVPHFEWGVQQCKEIGMEATQSNPVRSERGWRLFLLLPRLLFRPSRGDFSGLFGGRKHTLCGRCFCGIADFEAHRLLHLFNPTGLLQPSVRAWLNRWRGLLACAAAQSFPQSLQGNIAPGVDGAVPSMQDVLCDFRHLL